MRFPDMLQVGDITKLNGATLPPVEVICGGSPCQDLSVAGARAGLAGARSGLFMEQCRIVKEMRDEIDYEANRFACSTQIHVLEKYLAPSPRRGRRLQGRPGEIVRIKVPAYMSLDLTPGAGNLLNESYWEMLSPGVAMY